MLLCTLDACVRAISQGFRQVWSVRRGDDVRSQRCISGNVRHASIPWQAVGEVSEHPYHRVLPMGRRRSRQQRSRTHFLGLLWYSPRVCSCHEALEQLLPARFGRRCMRQTV